MMRSAHSPAHPQRVTAVILAAGQSSRMGRPKQLAEVGGQPMIVRAVQTALASGADEVLVVIGAYAGAVTAALQPLQTTVGAQVRLVENPDFASGQASSIRTAIRALDGRAEAALFLPVDQPFLTPALLQRLITAWRVGAQLAASAVDGRVRGAPALFDHALWPELLALTGDEGARPLLRKYAEQIVPVTADAAELRDIDTPDELATVQS
jgi:molybdenum cofactor cytidylyltransferase